MNHPGAPLKVVGVPWCVKGHRGGEWICRVVTRNRFTDDTVKLTVVAACDANTCRLERG